MGTIVDKADELANRGEETAERLGNHLVDGFQLFALFAIGATIVWSAAVSYFGMMQQGVASVEDILLLFIFLELGAMVGIYFKTNRLPVQFLLYVAVTVMTRSLASSLSIKDMTDQRLLVISGSILVLAVASFVLRYSTETEIPFITHTDNEGTEGQAGKRRRSKKGTVIPNQ
jgi:phosphate starvation-inducible membrane PsiE